MLAASLELFGARGYGGTSLQAISDRLGCTKAAVYYHFSAKADLLSALAASLLEGLDVVLQEAPETREGRRILLGAYLDAVLGATVLSRLLIADPTAREHPAAVRLLAQRGRLRDLLVPPGDQSTGRVRASCSLGAIEGAVLHFDDTDPALQRTVILAAAMTALDPPLAAGRRAPRASD
jgi:AcrR family transcriptional regulator